MTILYLWKWILSQAHLDSTGMAFVVQSIALVFLIGICVVDATTVYFEVRWSLHEPRVSWKRNGSVFKLLSTFVCFLFLSVSQNSSKITSKSCDPTLVSKENISYKNPYSSFMSKTTFWWITPLLWKGFFKPLELSDLGNLSETDSSRHHYDQFLFIYQSFKVVACLATYLYLLILVDERLLFPVHDKIKQWSNSWR